MHSVAKLLSVICLAIVPTAFGFTVPSSSTHSSFVSKNNLSVKNYQKNHVLPTVPSTTELKVVEADLDVVALVAGQENYGLAIVAVGEAMWSFLSAPSLDHAKVLVPAAISAVILGAVSGPMIYGGSADSIGTGLEIATAVSVLLGLSYVARLVAPYSPSAKEIAFGGLLISVAGFFSFSQNLLVDGFITLPSIPLPTLPSIQLPF